MSIFLHKTLISPVLGTTQSDFDYDYQDLFTVLLNVRRIVNEILTVLKTPKGSIFKARHLGSTLYLHEFDLLTEERSMMLVEELKNDIMNQVSGVSIEDMSFLINKESKRLKVMMKVLVNEKSYILPTIEVRL